MRVLVIASDHEHPTAARVWGTGGWTPPLEREARDWFALSRLLGWETLLATPALERVPAGVGVVIAACDVTEPLARALRVLLEAAPALVVMRADTSAPSLRGRELGWHGPGEPAAWRLDAPAEAVALDGYGEPWLTLDGAVAAAARRVGRGTVATLGFHPSAARDQGAGVTGALRTLLTRGIPGDAAWLDTSGALALRMDDPGGAQNVHLEPWAYRELGPGDWRRIASELRSRDARLAVSVVPGWVDDGDPSRGELLVDGRPASRAPGRVHPSWRVAYRDRGGRVHDYGGEFAALRTLAAEGILDVVAHGRTHIEPRLDLWAAAADRHTAVHWYRELGGADGPAALAAGAWMLAEFFGSPPAAIVFPGDAWTNAALERALDCGLAMVASYYVALRDGARWCWAEQVCSPYLDEPDRRWFDAGIPVVGYFHARDLATNGVEWMAELLDGWRAAGASRIIGLGELAYALDCRVRVENGRVLVRTPGHRAPAPLHVALRRAGVTRQLLATAHGAGGDIEVAAAPP